MKRRRISSYFYKNLLKILIFLNLLTLYNSYLQEEIKNNYPNTNNTQIEENSRGVNGKNIKTYTNCNIIQSKLVFIFMENFNLQHKPDLTTKNTFSSSIRSYFSILKSFDILNKPLYSSFKCPFNCTKTFTKKDFSILHYHIFHLDEDLLLKNQKCLSDYCNIFDCNKIKEYLSYYHEYQLGDDNKSEGYGYTMINQRKVNCDEDLISSYKLLCLALLNDLPLKFEYCSEISCHRKDVALYNNFNNSLLFIKYIIGILVSLFSIVYLVIIWLNKLL